MIVNGLEFDDNNLEHIGRHHITPLEVEEACSEKHITYKARYERYVICGQAVNGKYIRVILIRLYDSIFRPVTAYEMSEGEKKSYKRVMH